MTLVAGIDSSTQSCKVVIRDLARGTLVRSGQAAHPEGTEVDPGAWWDALLAAIDVGGGLDDVAAVSIAGQQHGMVVLDTSGRVIRQALLWNDARSAQAALDLIAEVGQRSTPSAPGSCRLHPSPRQSCAGCATRSPGTQPGSQPSRFRMTG